MLHAAGAVFTFALVIVFVILVASELLPKLLAFVVLVVAMCCAIYVIGHGLSWTEKFVGPEPMFWGVAGLSWAGILLYMLRMPVIRLIDRMRGRDHD